MVKITTLCESCREQGSRSFDTNLVNIFLDSGEIAISKCLNFFINIIKFGLVSFQYYIVQAEKIGKVERDAENAETGYESRD